MTQHAPLKRLLHAVRSRRRTVRGAALWSITNKVFDLAPPLLIGASVSIVVDRENSWFGALGVADPKTQLLILGALTVLIWVIESISEYLAKVAWRNLAQSVQHDLRIEAYQHVQDLEMAWFEDRSTGGLMAVLNDDVNQLERFLDNGAHELLQVGTTVLVIGSLFFALEPSVAWMGVAPMPFILWGSIRYQRLLAPRYAAVREQVGLLNHQLANNLGGIATIKSFTAEAHETQRLDQTSQQYREANRKAIRLSSAFSPLIRMIIVAGFTAMLVQGGLLALEGSLDVGAYSVMVFLVQRLLWPLTRLGETFDLYQRAMASTTRILDLLDTQPSIVDGAGAAAEPEAPVRPTVHQHVRQRVRPEVAFEQVEFSYTTAGRLLPPTLRTLDLQIRRGETTAIVGATGSGKTTVIKLLLRFYDVTGGRITLDGVDVRQLSLADLRQSIGLVSQDVYLFHGTVLENIAYGRRGASRDDVIAAARTAEAHAFIESLPLGYDTLVGERGQKLSGGQRQRLSIARAVLKDPPLLVLDEATSSVDNETEAAIQRSLARLAVGRTTLVIAHRLSTVRHAQRIWVLSAGQVTESGTHEELLAQGGQYKSLWDVQTGEALTEAELP